MSTRNVRIESGSNSDGLRIYIRDEASGVMLAGFVLDVQQTWDLLRGGTVRAEATMTNHFDRVGREMETQSVMYSSSDLEDAPYADQEAAAVERAMVDLPGWDEYDGRRRGGIGGVHVVARRWR